MLAEAAEEYCRDLSHVVVFARRKYSPLNLTLNLGHFESRRDR